MAYSYRTTDIARASTPTADMLRSAGLNFTSVAKGDALDGPGFASLSDNDHFVGWQYSAGWYREEVVQGSVIPARIKRGSRVVGATLHLAIIGSSWPSGTVVADGTNWVDVWAIRRTLVLGSTIMTTMTPTNYTTGTAWDELGIKFGVGNDTDPTYIGRFQWTQGNHDAAPSDTVPVFKTVSMRAELARILAFDEQFQFALKAEWDKPASGTTERRITINVPALSAAKPHSYLTLNYRQPLEFYGSTSDFKVDQANLKDFNSAGLDQHLFLGTPSLGAVGAVQTFFVRNESDSPQPAVLVLTGRSIMGSVSHDGVASTLRLRYPRVYDTASGQATPTGRWRLVFTSATLFNALFTPEGSTVETTVSTGLAKASDQVIQYSSLNALNILSAAWSGTATAADVVAFDTFGDLHTTAVPLASLDVMRLARHEDGDRTSGETLEPRVASRMRACQLYRHDTAAIANSGGATGVIGNVSGDGANDGTHIKVPDTTIFTADDYATLARYEATDETNVTGTIYRVEHVRIKTVYSMTHATYPGQLGLYQTVATPTDFDSNSIFTTGVWLGKEDVADQGFLSTAASTSSDLITLDTTPSRTTGTVTLLDPTSGQTQTAVIASYPGGTSLRLTAPPTYDYPAQSLVYFGDETKSNVDFFMWAEPPATGTRGRKLGYPIALSWAIT
jgi:hypothetical protein